MGVQQKGHDNLLTLNPPGLSTVMQVCHGRGVQETASAPAVATKLGRRVARPTPTPAEKRMSLMTHQSYGPKVAVPRQLQILERQDTRATFFIPGFTAECYPDVVRRIADGGHEIAHHGYLHEPMQGTDAATEARYLDRGLDALAKAAGIRPTGYRAPWWELNWHSAALLADRGFLYDPSLLDGDPPYRFSVGEGSPRDLVEIPVDWALDDWEQYAFHTGVTGSGVIESPAKVLEMWTLEAEAHHAAGSCFVLTNHPFISARPTKAVALEQLMDRVKSLDGMWVTTMAEIAEYARQSVEEIHSHARIAVPGFPDTGARCTGAWPRRSARVKLRPLVEGCHAVELAVEAVPGGILDQRRDVEPDPPGGQQGIFLPHNVGDAGPWSVGKPGGQPVNNLEYR